MVEGWFKPPNMTGTLESIALAFGIEIMAGKGWERVGIGQIKATTLSDRGQHTH